jgi:hypothetical protein
LNERKNEMANRITPAGSTLILQPLASSTLKAILLSQALAPNANPVYLSEIEAWRIGTDQTLIGISVGEDGIFRWDDVVWSTLPTGNTIHAVAFYVDTGNPATSKVFLVLDTISGVPRLAESYGFTLAAPDGAFTLIAG